MARTTVSVYLQTITSGFQHGLNQAKKKWQGFTNYLKTTQGMVLSALGIGSFREIINGWDSMAKNARNIGVSAEYYQKLAFAAERSNAELTTVFETFSRLKTAQAAAVQGDAARLKSFENIGITLDQLKTLNPEQLFDAVTDGLKNTADKMVANDAAAKLLGETYSKLGVFMADYKTLGAELERNGGIVSDETLAAAEQFNDQMTDLVTKLKSLIGNTGILKMIANGLQAINMILSGAVGKEREEASKLALKAGLLDRRGVVNRLLTSGDLTDIERSNLMAGGKRWADGAVNSREAEIIDEIMRKYGYGQFAGTSSREAWWHLAPTYTPGASFINDPLAMPILEGKGPKPPAVEYIEDAFGELADTIEADAFENELVEVLKALEESAPLTMEPEIQKAAAALAATGDFSAAALKQKLGLKPEERTAAATEETARIAAKIAAKMDEQSIVYTE